MLLLVILSETINTLAAELLRGNSTDLCLTLAAELLHVILLVYTTQHFVFSCSTLILHILQLLQYADMSIAVSYTHLTLPTIYSV